MKKFISLFLATMMIATLAVINTSAVVLFRDDFTEELDDGDKWFYGAFVQEPDKGYVEGYSEAVVLQSYYDNTEGVTAQQGNVWDTFSAQSEIVLVEDEFDGNLFVGHWYANYATTLDENGEEDPALSQETYYFIYNWSENKFALLRDTMNIDDEDPEKVLFVQDSSVQYKLGDTVKLGTRVDEGKISCFIDGQFLFSYEKEGIGLYKSPFIVWNSGFHVQVNSVVVGTPDELALPGSDVVDPGNNEGGDPVVDPNPVDPGNKDGNDAGTPVDGNNNGGSNNANPADTSNKPASSSNGGGKTGDVAAIVAVAMVVALGTAIVVKKVRA